MQHADRRCADVAAHHGRATDRRADDGPRRGEADNGPHNRCRRTHYGTERYSGSLSCQTNHSRCRLHQTKGDHRHHPGAHLAGPDGGCDGLHRHDATRQSV